jgi:hypothetical protein
MQCLKPVIILFTNKQFDGSPSDILDNISHEDFALRSNYYKTLTVNNVFPLYDGEIAYAKNVLVFRDERLEISNNKYTIAVITFALTKKPVLLGPYMRPDDYLEYQESLESIFQGACVAGHDTLIFSDLGANNYGIPSNETIEILNLCILKYCTLFKFIIFAISEKGPGDMKLLAQFNKDLIKPQIITEEIMNNAYTTQ